MIFVAKVWGPADGIPVLAVHGWQDNAGSFDTLAPLLPASIRLVCLEFCGNYSIPVNNFVKLTLIIQNLKLGHGFSSHYAPGMFLNYYDHVYHIKMTIDYFKWKKVIILGHRLAVQYAFFKIIQPNSLLIISVWVLLLPFSSLPCTQS